MRSRPNGGIIGRPIISSAASANGTWYSTDMAQLVQQYRWPIPPIGVIIYNAAGGTIYTDSANNRKYHTFSGNGTFSIGQGQGGFADILVVGAGGAGGGGTAAGTGGGWSGGGGGAGGLIYLQNVYFPQGNHTITVGVGGLWNLYGANSTYVQSTAGQNSSISISGTGAQYNAIGGGSGASFYSYGSVVQSSIGVNGGSGGGGGQYVGGINQYTSQVAGGSSLTDSIGTYNGTQGYNGTSPVSEYVGSGFSYYISGGGGGGSGGSGSSSGAPTGGPGTAISFLNMLGLGVGGYIAGGGAGASYTPFSGGSSYSVPGGSGGGGGNSSGTNASNSPQNGAINTGSGGSGGNNGLGAAGGSGLVVINYRYQ